MGAVDRHPVRRVGYAVAAVLAAAASVTVSAAQSPATPHIYWANFGTDTIGEANLNGTDANQQFIADANSPDGVAVDGNHPPIHARANVNRRRGRSAKSALAT